MDLAPLFRLSVSPLELLVRGTAMYWFLFLLFRVVLRRDIGAIGIADMLLIVVIADASQNAMAGDYHTVTDGVVLVSTIAGWNWLLDWASYRYTRLRRWLAPQPLSLVRDGQLQRQNLRREFVTLEELHAKLRESGVDDLMDVKLAVMEADGAISVIRKEPPEPPPSPRDAAAASSFAGATHAHPGVVSTSAARPGR